MSPVLVATALAVAAGAVVAVSARRAWVALVGLGVAIVLAPFLADPPPPTAAVAARLVASGLALELLWVAVRATTDRTRGSLLGLPTEALAAGAAWLAGYAIAASTSGADLGEVVGPPTSPGPAAELAAGFALLVLAAAPVLVGRDVLRLAIGVLLLVTGAGLVRTATAGATGSFEELLIAGVTVAAGVAGAVGCLNAYAASAEFGWGPGRRPEGTGPVATPAGRGDQRAGEVHGPLVGRAVRGVRRRTPRRPE